MSERSIFLEAADIDDPARRAEYLDGACAGDAVLRGEVEELLRAHLRPDGFMQQPAPAVVTTLDAPTAEAPGAVIAGRYKLLELIGAGGMGEVWVADQVEPIRRRVALKLIKPGMDSRAVLARFEAERQALALMDHPNIARVLDAGTAEGGRPFFVMELVKGTPITQFCDERKLSTRERLELFVPVCQAIQHAHQKGVIHRDVKPSNVLVELYDDRAVPKVIDFGVAKAVGQKLTERTLYTGFGALVGTPAYMAPEQATFNALDVDTRADVYSLGVLLYELLSGSPPFEPERLRAAALDEVLRLVREEEPPRPSHRLSTSQARASIAAVRHTEPAKLANLLRGELDWIVMKALEKDRARRYETANGLARDVQRYLSDEPVEASPPSATYRLRKFAKKNRGALATACLFAVMLVAGTFMSLWQAKRAFDAESRAQKRLAQLERGNEVITSIFADLDIRRVREGTEPLEAVLAQRLVRAAGQLEGEAVGDPLVVAGLQDRLGQSLISLGYPGDAIPLFVKARATREAHLGADDPLTLASANNLGKGYLNAGRLDRALPLLEETLGLRKARLGPDHADTLTSMAYLGKGYLDAGKLDLALPLLEETLKLRKANLGADDPDTLSSMGSLAWGYRIAGKPDLALPLWEEDQKLRKAGQGVDHPATLKSMGMLGLGYQDAGKPGLALPLLEETVRLMKARLGSDHPETLTATNNLGYCYLRAGKPEAAVTILEEVRKLGTARQGADHHETLTTTNNLAKAYQDAGRADRAIPLLEETLKLLEAKLTADHPLALTSTSNLAKGYQDAGKLDLALPLFEQAAAGIEKRQFRHENAGRIIPNTIRAYEAAGQPDGAERWQRKWLAAVKDRSGAESPPYAGELAALGRILLAQRKWAEAETTLRECLAVRGRAEPDAWTTFDTRSMLGAAILGQKNHADAEPLLLKGYEGLKQRERMIDPRATDTSIPDALDRLIELYTVTNKPEAAKKWRAVRAKYKALAPPPREKV